MQVRHGQACQISHLRKYLHLHCFKILQIKNFVYNQLSCHIYLAGSNEFRPPSLPVSPPQFCTPQVISHRFRALGKSQNPADYTICRLKSGSSFQLKAMQRQQLKRHKKRSELSKTQPYLLPALTRCKRTCKWSSVTHVEHKYFAIVATSLAHAAI